MFVDWSMQSELVFNLHAMVYLKTRKLATLVGDDQMVLLNCMFLYLYNLPSIKLL